MPAAPRRWGRTSSAGPASRRLRSSQNARLKEMPIWGPVSRRTLIRNQQVISSSLIAGSIFPNKFADSDLPLPKSTATGAHRGHKLSAMLWVGVNLAPSIGPAP